MTSKIGLFFVKNSIFFLNKSKTVSLGGIEDHIIAVVKAEELWNDYD